MKKEELQQLIPKGYRSFVTDEVVKFLNAAPDSTTRELFRENFIRYTDVISGKSAIGVVTYVRAVKFCSLRLIGDSLADAYRKVFPERCINKTEQQIVDSAAAFNHRKIVQRIMERAMIPVHILNADIHQEAINTQAELMRTAKSEMVRMKAAESLIQHLKKPEAQKVQLDVRHNTSQLEELMDVTRQLAIQQKKAIEEKRADVIEIVEGDIFSREGGFISGSAEGEAGGDGFNGKGRVGSPPSLPGLPEAQ